METDRISTRLSGDDLKALQREAKATSTTVSEVVRRAVVEHLARQGGASAPPAPAPAAVAIPHPTGPAPGPRGTAPDAAGPESGPQHRGPLAAALERFDRLWASEAAGPGPTEPRARDGEGAGGEAGHGTGRQRR